MTQKTTFSGPKIALYQPDIPQNTAAIIRTCSCLGVKLEIIEPCGFFFTDSRFKRVVMDYMDINLIKFYKSYEDLRSQKAKIGLFWQQLRQRKFILILNSKKMILCYLEEKVLGYL